MKLIQLNIKGISYSETQTGAYALILSEVDGNRRLPIIIGGFEAQSIAIALEKELKDLRAEYITTKSELMFMSKQTEVEKLVAEQGLFKGNNQPIVIKKN